MALRSIQAGLHVVENEDTLERGFQTTRRLWNYTWWCMFGYNEKLRRARGDNWETFKRNRSKEKYPGNFTMQKELKDHWAYHDLSDRCASYTVKDFDIACRSWFSNLRSNPDARPPKPTKQARTLTFEVGRNAKPAGNFTYKLTVLGGHIAERHVVVKVHVRPGVKMADVKMLRIKPNREHGRYEVSLIVNRVSSERPGERVAAIDLGIINLGALAFDTGETMLYSGRALLDLQRHAEKHAARCKPSTWEPGKNKLPPSERNKSYKRTATDTIDLAIHNFTTSVIQECTRRDVSVLLVGDLTGILKDKDFGAKTNQKMHRWTQGRVREHLTWKGEDAGIEVKQISEAYTSQTCSVCGTVRKSSRVNRGLYSCPNCGTIINADVNGAFNMLHKVSPETTVFGVGADLPGQPSTAPESKDRAGNRRTSSTVAKHPTFVAKFNLQTWEVIITRQAALEPRLQHNG